MRFHQPEDDLIDDVPRIRNHLLILVQEEPGECGRESNQDRQGHEISQVDCPPAGHPPVLDEIIDHRIDEVSDKSGDDQLLQDPVDDPNHQSQEQDGQSKDHITNRAAPLRLRLYRHFFTASRVGSITGASATACMAARTSFNPDPVLTTSTASSGLITPWAAALTRPA